MRSALFHYPANHSFNQTVHGARGLLALFVFLFHVAYSGLPNFDVLGGTSSVSPIFTCLQYGVELFFCISGYVVGGALRRAGSPRKFLLDRAFRILPVLWLSLLIIVPLGIITKQTNFSTLSPQEYIWVIPANFLVLPGVFPLPLLHLAAWSLSYEALFYILAVAFSAFSGRGVRLLLGLAMAGLVVWHPRSVFFGVGYLTARFDLTRIPAMSLAARWVVPWMLVFLGAWYMVHYASPDMSGRDDMLAWFGTAAAAWAVLAIVAAVVAWTGIVAQRGVIGHVLRSKSFQFLGAVSYSFYIWHLLVLAVVKRGMSVSGTVGKAGPWSQIVLLVIALPICLVVSYLSAQFIEQRLTKWLKARYVG